MPCEVVVQTVYGLTRCTAPDETVFPMDTEHMELRNRRTCSFHASNPTLPRCVAILRSGMNLRCSLAAVRPAENPQYCQDCWDYVQSVERIEAERNLEAERNRVRVVREEIRRNTIPWMLDEPITDVPLPDSQTVWNWEPDEMYMQDRMNQQIPRREENMPSVGFSQAATPFVAALVQRLGGEVTVPARRLERGEVLAINRVTNGLRLSIMRGRDVVRTPMQVNSEAAMAASVAPPPVQTKYEIEKVRDEEEFELRKTLQKCPECGLQFEKAHKKPDGKDECPYCEIRRIESVDKTSEIETLKEALDRANLAAIEWRDKATRFERMLQEKLELVSRKSTEIKQLKIALEHGTQVPAAGSRLNAIQEMRAAAQAQTVRGGLRARIEEAIRPLGGVVQTHSTMSTTGSQEERHRLEIILPLRSQLENP